jgi:CRISPR-associated protein Cas1
VKRHLNTLFVTTQGSYLGKDGQAVDVRVDRESRLRVPVINLGGIVCFGQVSVSPALMALCAESDVSVTFMSEHGRFLARVTGFTPGNVLLRREQYRRADQPAAAVAIARNMVAAKIANGRTVLMRATRDYPDAPGRDAVERAYGRLAQLGLHARAAQACEGLLGVEGEAGSTYFGVFDHLLTAQRDTFAFRGRSRRPPLDPVNALLSFLYALLANDARAACESCGLDPAVGFLHRDRPGRPGLALDLMEELRPFLADRLAVSLVNRQQVRAGGFTTTESGGVLMDDATRRVVLTAYQERKQEVLTHPFLGEKTTVGLIVHLQARLLARHLRGDLDSYPPFIWK